MIYYLVLPFLSVLLVVLQISIADAIFSGGLILEISLIVVIYAGFRLDLVKGLTLAFILGFVYDCLTGSVLGLFTFIYMVIFMCSFFVSIRLSTEKLYFIALFSLICSFFEEILVILFYNLAYGVDIAKKTPLLFFPQAVLISLLAILFFYLMRRTEGFLYGKTFQSTQRARTGRLSSEA
jgi:rod shape-determining protein MreD